MHCVQGQFLSLIFLLHDLLVEPTCLLEISRLFYVVYLPLDRLLCEVSKRCHAPMMLLPVIAFLTRQLKDILTNEVSTFDAHAGLQPSPAWGQGFFCILIVDLGK